MSTISKRLHREAFSGIIQVDAESREELLNVLVGYTTNANTTSQDVFHIDSKAIMRMSDEERQNVYDKIVAQYGIGATNK